MENNNQRVLIFVTIATILILAIIFIGMTYAFFTANNPEGSTAEIKSETGRMLITYNDGTDNIVPVTNIQPSNTILVNKTFTLTGSNTTVGMSEGDGLSMPYKVGVQYTSTFSDGMMHYYIKEVNRPTNSNVTVNYVITPEPGKTEDDYKNQTVPGNDTYTGYTHGTFKNGSKYTEMVTGDFPASLNDQTITFNLIIQFPDNNENQDSEKGKTFNGKVVVNYEAPQPNFFAEDTWATIASNIQSGNTSRYNVGDTKEIAIDGFTNREPGSNGLYTVRVANYSFPSECRTTGFSQTACGFVVEFVDIVEFRKMNSTDTNVGGWPATLMRSYLNGDTSDHLTYTYNGTNATLYSKLPSDLRNVIIDTTVVSGHGSTDKNVFRDDGNYVSRDKIYLLSTAEVWGDCLTADGNSGNTCYDTASYPYNGNGAMTTRQLDYYSNKSVSTSSNLTYAIKNYYGTAVPWWLRAAYSSNDYKFGAVHDTGHGVYEIITNNIGGVAPAFRIG